MGVVAGSMKIGDGMVDVVLALEPPGAKALHKCSPEEPDQVSVATIVEHLQVTKPNKHNAGRGLQYRTPRKEVKL